jgi:hypothetical protein
MFDYIKSNVFKLLSLLTIIIITIWFAGKDMNQKLSASLYMLICIFIIGL